MSRNLGLTLMVKSLRVYRGIFCLSSVLRSSLVKRLWYQRFGIGTVGRVGRIWGGGNGKTKKVLNGKNICILYFQLSMEFSH